MKILPRLFRSSFGSLEWANAPNSSRDRGSLFVIIRSDGTMMFSLANISLILDTNCLSMTQLCPGPINTWKRRNNSPVFKRELEKSHVSAESFFDAPRVPRRSPPLSFDNIGAVSMPGWAVIVKKINLFRECKLLLSSYLRIVRKNSLS